jgi:hypothetical protein
MSETKATTPLGTKNAKAPRDAAAHAGGYAIPYVAQLRMAPAAGAALIAAGAGSVVAGIWAGARFGVAILVLDLVMVALIWVLARNRVTLEENSLAYRRFAKERVVRYEDIEGVSTTLNVLATGRGIGVAVLLRLKLRREPPVDINVTALSERDRAIIVDHLQRSAPQATFSRDVRGLWTSAP